MVEVIEVVEVPRRLPLEQAQKTFWNESRAWRINVPIAIPPTRPRIAPMRLYQDKLIPRAGHRDVEQAPLLFDLLLAPRGHVRRNTAVHDVQHDHGLPFLSLRRMDGRKDQVLLIDQWISCQVTQSFGWIESQVAQKGFSCLVIVAEVFEGLEVGEAYCGSLIQPFELWLVPLSNHAELTGPLGGLPQSVHQGAKARRNGSAPVEDSACVRRPNSWQQLEHSESRDVVARILGPPQDAEYILDVGRLQKLEPPVLHERDVAAAELDFEQVGVVGGAHQDGLVVQGDAGLTLLKHPFYYIVRLGLLVLRGHEKWLLLRPALREQVLFEPLTPDTYNGV